MMKIWLQKTWGNVANVMLINAHLNVPLQKSSSCNSAIRGFHYKTHFVNLFFAPAKIKIIKSLKIEDITYLSR